MIDEQMDDNIDQEIEEYQRAERDHLDRLEDSFNGNY